MGAAVGSRANLDSQVLSLEAPAICDEKQNYLVLDLDETLIHARNFKFHESCVYIPISNNGNSVFFYVMPRPGLINFLQTMNKYFTLCIYTASNQQYAEKILQELGVSDYFRKVYHRGHCKPTFNNNFEKHLDVLQISAKNLVFIDDSAKHIMQNTMNGLQIPPFLGDEGDKELENLIPFLIQLSNESDVRPVAAKMKKFQQEKEAPLSRPLVLPRARIVANTIPESSPKVFMRKNSENRPKNCNNIQDKQQIEEQKWTKHSQKQKMTNFQKRLLPLTIGKSRRTKIVSI